MTGTPSPETAAPSAPANAPKSRGGMLEWFLRRQTLAEARRAVPELDPQQRERMLRARAALELADRTLDPVDELKAGRGTPLACMLYREAIYWALLAQDSTQNASSVEEALAAAPRQVLLDAAGGDTAFVETEAAARKSSPETWQEPEAVQQADARKLQALARGLLRRLSDPEQRLARIVVQRAVRMTLLALLSALVITGVVLLLRSPAGPDLAAGKPWRASSTFAKCNPKERECGGSRTVIFFCTQEELNPWMEIDLGKLQEFSRVEVQNRTDCCDERAVPLAIEVSEDAVKWREVARKTELFSLWKADFPKVRARYVRTRALARTFLHLERVSVRER
jgi:hypothetical protein